MKHYKGFGLTPRHKRSGGRHAADVRLMTHTDISRVVNFLVNFVEDHALVLPGRVPGFKRFDIKLLPSSYTKASIWRLFETAIEAAGCTSIEGLQLRLRPAGALSLRPHVAWVDVFHVLSEVWSVRGHL